MFDPAHPFQTSLKHEARPETILVFFEGLIKNPSEGIVRTMLRDEDEWIEKYPKLEEFEEMEMTELYENTMLFPPIEIMKLLSDYKLSDEEIEDDLEVIEPDIILDNSLMTRFEFSLYNILKDPIIEKCYIYKEGYFFQNEIDYITRHYANVMDKISIIHGIDFIKFFNSAKDEVTTFFIVDHSFISDYIMNNIDAKEIEDKMFIVLNSIYNVEMLDDSEDIVYTEEYAELTQKLEENDMYGIGSMFNLAIEPRDDNTEEHDDDNDEE